MARNLSHTPHVSPTSNHERNTAIHRGHERFDSIGSRKVPANVGVTIPYGGYHMHLRNGARTHLKPVPTNVTGVSGSNIIMVECYHDSARAKQVATAAKTVMGDSPGVYHVSHGKVRLGTHQGNQLLLSAVEPGAKFSRAYASDTSDSGSDTSEIRRSDDRRQILFQRPIAGGSNTSDVTFDDRCALEPFAKPGVSPTNTEGVATLQDTSPERKAARAKRRERKQRRK